MNRLNAYYGSVQHFLNLYLIIALAKKGLSWIRVKQMEGQKALALVERDLQAPAYREEQDGKIYFEFPDILMVSYKNIFLIFLNVKW